MVGSFTFSIFYRFNNNNDFFDTTLDTSSRYSRCARNTELIRCTFKYLLYSLSLRLLILIACFTVKLFLNPIRRGKICRKKDYFPDFHLIDDEKAGEIFNSHLLQCVFYQLFSRAKKNTTDETVFLNTLIFLAPKSSVL